METKKSERDLADVLVSLARFLKAAGEEILLGVINNRVPASATILGIAIAAVFYTRGDAWLASFFTKKYYLPLEARNALTQVSIFSGWIFWGIRRAGLRNRLLNKLTDAFQAANLKCNGRYPSLLDDVRIDEYVRKLRLHSNGVTKSDFEKAVERLETVLNTTIVKVNQDERDKGKIEIVYAMKDMERKAILENPESFADGDIPIGESYEGPIKVNMRDVGHILVAGQTGGGKSNFLKVVTTVLTRNNERAQVLFFDFKGGMESADLREHAQNLGPNIKCFEGTKSCIDELGKIGGALENRFKVLSEAGAATFDVYLKKKESKKAEANETLRQSDEKRMFIIIDEIAQLYTNSPGITKEAQAAAKEAVNRISRQGRAAGVHLIVATQKPDSQSFDQTVKANLPAVLCFPMANQASSVAAVGTKRAYEINPYIKGRAVWKFGPKLEEVQTYLFG